MTSVPSTHKASSRPRAEWHRRFSEARDEGQNGLAIARLFGVGHTFVYSVLNDPAGTRDKKRKQRYGGVCEGCGARTDGSNGRAKAPKLCDACTREQRTGDRIWGRDDIIDAIQRWAAEHGRPPSATDWHYAPSGYPFTSQVHQADTPGMRRNPFRYWADAIEAAGFPRPSVGHYQRDGTLAGAQYVQRAAYRLAERRPKRGITAPELRAETGCSKTGALKALKSLARRGLLTQDEKRGRSHVYRYKTPTR